MDSQPSPLIGITPAFDDGTDLQSLRPHVALHFLDAAYPRAIQRAGGTPLILPLTQDTRIIDRYLDTVDGLVFSGGGGFLRQRHVRMQALPDLKALAPRRYAFEAALLERALRRDLPILGTCRGHQMIVRITGGRCYSQIQGRVAGALDHYREELPIGGRPAHRIRIRPGSVLHRVLGREVVGVNSLHRQAAERVVPPLFVTAWAEDGVVEAVESGSHRFVVGVQFHPELMPDEEVAWTDLFAALVSAARAYRIGPAVPAGLVGSPAAL